MNKNLGNPSRQTISMTTLRLKTREVVEKVFYTQDIFIVKAYDRPMAAIIGIAQFEKLIGLAASNEFADGKIAEGRVERNEEGKP
jgi:prevent-host-death family protein